MSVPEEADGIGRVMEALNANNTDIEYLYLFRTKKEKALVLGVLDPERSAQYLLEKGFSCLSDV